MAIKTIADVAEAITNRRNELGMSRRQLFLKAGLSKPCMEKIERGENTSLKSLLKVFEVLGLELKIK